MKSTGNRKRSIIVMGKRTSVCLEESFWLSLHAIVQMERTTIETFVARVKSEHDPRNLSSSLRVAILDYFQDLAATKSGAACGTMPAISYAKPPKGNREMRDRVVAFWSGLRQPDSMHAK